MKKWILLFLLPLTVDADIPASRTAVDSVVANRSYLSVMLGISVMNSIAHPDWVQVDFPLTSSSGVAKRRIEAVVRDLIARGGEPAYRDSTIGLPRGQYIRMFIPGRIYIHRDIVIDALKRIASSGVDTAGIGIGATARDMLDDAGWRRLLHQLIPDRF